VLLSGQVHVGSVNFVPVLVNAIPRTYETGRSGENLFSVARRLPTIGPTKAGNASVCLRLICEQWVRIPVIDFYALSAYSEYIAFIACIASGACYVLTNQKGTMKKNSKPKPIKSKPAAAPNPAPASAPATFAAATESVQYELPPPEILLQEAEQETDQAILLDYVDVIKTLREKHFSFREVADWMNARGFNTDRNEVYRVFWKALTPEEIAAEEQSEREEALE